MQARQEALTALVDEQDREQKAGPQVGDEAAMAGVVAGGGFGSSSQYAPGVMVGNDMQRSVDRDVAE